MMITPSGITISFGGTRGGNDDSRPVVARICGFASGDDDAPIMREMVVPAGASVEQDLPQGLYNVELTLPSGRIIQRNVRIHEDSNETYQFFDDFAEPAGFSLQETVGRNANAILERAVAASSSTRSPLDRLDSDSSLERLGEGRDKGAFGVHGVAKGLKSLEGAEFPEAEQPAVSLGIGPLVPPDGSLSSVGVWRDAQPEERHGAAAIWRFTQATDSPPDAASRRWARVALSSGAVEVASLPLPWFSIGTGSFAMVELLVDPARADGAATSVAVHDERLSGLLAFLDRGQASSARPMLEALESENLIEQTISDKMSNPLAACAAAYVGLAVYPPQEREQWDVWLSNLMSRFQGVPDAAIVHARRLLLRPTARESNAQAAQVLRQACTAGVPYFSAGVGLLREMLVLLSPDFPDLVPLADKAARLAARVDEQQAFTVLRYMPAKRERS